MAVRGWASAFNPRKWASLHADRLRAMYQDGRADALARWLSQRWASLFAIGVLPRRWVTLEVAGRRSGELRAFPLGMADLDGRWYLVSMLGERCNWVRNVRAAQGRAVIRHRRARRCLLVEVPVSERPAIITRYLDKVPGARPHIPVDRHAPLAAFAAVAERVPVFEVRYEEAGKPAPASSRSGS